MTDTTAPLPPVVLTAIATLRTASNWLPDDERDLLSQAADQAERSWDGGCCPICEETFCDGGCPLEDVRAGLYQQEPKVPAEALEVVAAIGRSWLDMELSTYNNPFRRNLLHQSAEPSPDCYEASFGWVHSRPSCRCKG